MQFEFQAYQLCIMDYDFMILNNAFLIHRPGIKTRKHRIEHDKANKKIVSAQSKVIKKHITPELTSIYGTRNGCKM